MNEEEAGIRVALSLTVNTEGERDGGKRDPRLRSLFKSTSPLSIQYIIFSTYNTDWPRYKIFDFENSIKPFIL